MKAAPLLTGLLAFFLGAACERSPKSSKSTTPEPAAPSAKVRTLLDARRGFTTKLLREERVGEAAPEPPAELFQFVRYPAAVGKLAAYVSPRPAKAGKHPAIIWIVGCFSNSISQIAWTPGPQKNDQSASAFREAGFVMMYPSLSKAEILSELPRLAPDERAEILESLWQLEEAGGPTENERAILNEAQAAYDADPSAGSSWREVEARLRKQS